MAEVQAPERRRSHAETAFRRRRRRKPPERGQRRLVPPRDGIVQAAPVAAPAAGRAVAGPQRRPLPARPPWRRRRCGVGRVNHVDDPGAPAQLRQEPPRPDDAGRAELPHDEEAWGEGHVVVELRGDGRRQHPRRLQLEVLRQPTPEEGPAPDVAAEPTNRFQPPGRYGSQAEAQEVKKTVQ